MYIFISCFSTEYARPRDAHFKTSNNENVQNIRFNDKKNKNFARASHFCSILCRFARPRRKNA